MGRQPRRPPAQAAERMRPMQRVYDRRGLPYPPELVSYLQEDLAEWCARADAEEESGLNAYLRSAHLLAYRGVVNEDEPSPSPPPPPEPFVAWCACPQCREFACHWLDGPAEEQGATVVARVCVRCEHRWLQI